MVKKQKTASLWIVDLYEVRRHSRVLYIPLKRKVVAEHELRKGDLVKFMLLHAKGQKPDSQKVKLWFVLVAPVRTHSRRLYLPLDQRIVDLFGIQKGDSIKTMLVEVFKTPRESDEE